MENQILISIPADQFWAKMARLIDERTQQIIDKSKPDPMQSYSINQVAKLLGRGHATIKELIKDGLLIATPDSRILHLELENYLTRTNL